MSAPVARGLFSQVKAQFPLPYSVTPKLVLKDPASVTPLRESDAGLHAQSELCLDVYDVERRLGILPIQVFTTIVRVASRCSISTLGYVTSVGPISSTDRPFVNWGHAESDLGKLTVDFVSSHFEEVQPQLIVDVFNRFSNALRLHNVALSTENSDLALLGFVGALESLFSVSPQELTFRLSFLLANFLGATTAEKRRYFSRAKKLYTIRSKISHGDKITEDEERSAIQLAEHWVPEAEELSRLALRAVIDQRLIDTFNSKAKHEQFLDDLLFRSMNV